MAKLIMGVGIPGAGKTSFLKPFAEKNAYTYICPDDIRAEISGNTLSQTVNKEAWAEAHRRVTEAFSKGENVVFDATFAKDFERKDFIEFARREGAKKVQGVFMATPLSVALRRNDMRDRSVPEYAIERMHRQLKDSTPIVEDGFDSVFDLNEFQELKRAEMQGEEKVLTKEFKPR